MVTRNCTIILLGETGVGKTTLVNIFGKYLANQSLPDIASNNISFLTPIRFSLVDEDYNEQVIQIGSSDSESLQVGASSTQRPQTYDINYPDQNVILRLVDTPGMGDTRGMESDKENTSILLRYLSEMDQIDAICIVLKADQSRATLLFEYCIREILRQLHPNIKQNIMFLFTHGRSCNYRPGESLSALRTVLHQIQQGTEGTVILDRSNIFCVDNEAIRYLAARSSGVNISDEQFKQYNNSFDRSRDAIRSMVDRALQLPPVKMQGVATINESKRIVARLSKPVFDLATKLEEAISNIKEIESKSELKQENIDYLKSNLFKFVPEIITLNTTETVQSQGFRFGATVNLKYSSFFTISGPFQFYIENENKPKILRNETIVHNRVLDTNVIAMIEDSESAKKAIELKLGEMKKLRKEYQQEITTALKALAHFFIFSSQNYYLTIEDPFEAILKAELEEAKLEEDEALKGQVETIIKKYEIRKNEVAKCAPVDPEDILNIVKELFELKHSGKNFRELMNVKFNVNNLINPISF